MAVKLRLKRMGAKKAPRYRIVAADSRFPRDGRDIETIGWINPTTEPETVFVDAEKAMNEYEDQLECSGFVTTACILFPDMEDEMSFEDFFSLIGVDDYEYLGEDTTAAGWLRFMYNGMEVMVNTNEAASGGGWNFTGAEIVKHNAPVSIVDTEIFNTNQDLADAVMFD